jgi:hypothetical protein
VKRRNKNGNNRRIAIRNNGKGKFSQTKLYPTLIVGGAVTMVKEQAPDTYARLLVLRDFVALTFDYASHGENEGSPRNNENVQGKLQDLKAGVSYLQTLLFVGEIGVLGACTTGGKWLRTTTGCCDGCGRSLDVRAGIGRANLGEGSNRPK